MPPRILIVDDEDVLRKHLVRFFAREGFEVASAGSRAEAAKALVSTRFGTVLIDVSLPDGDGLDLLAALDGDRRPAQTIVITAFSTPENERRATALGVAHLLPKPVDLPHLLRVVRSGVAPGAGDSAER